jgi:methylenetetrahydrofolate reductase (NADPH)
MPLHAHTSAEISLPSRPHAGRVINRIAALADQVDLVGLTDNHAGQPRMSPLAAVALARDQGVATVVHVSCRDRNRFALQSQVVGAVALDSDGVLCLQGDPVPGMRGVGDLTTTQLLADARKWIEPSATVLGCVVNPFAPDLDRELRLLQRKLDAGAAFVQSQMVFDLDRFRAFLDRATGMLGRARFYAGVGLLRNQRMADHVNTLPGLTLPERSYRLIAAGGGLELATELATELAGVEKVDALHVYPLGAEASVSQVAAAFRSARDIPPRERPRAPGPAAGGSPAAG